MFSSLPISWPFLLNFFHDFIDFSLWLVDQSEMHLWHENSQIENARISFMPYVSILRHVHKHHKFS